MTSRHHYSIPGASLLKPRAPSKQQPQKLSSGNASGPSRDTRQPSSSRAYYTQETLPRNNPPSRPPSASGYRTQQPAAHASGFLVPGGSRPPSVHRQSITPQPQASSSKTRLDTQDQRGYFSKMFGRRSSSAAPQVEDKHKSSYGHQRSTVTQMPPATYPVTAAMPSQPQTAATSNWAAYEALVRAREGEREERARQKTKEERIRGKEERMRSEHAAYKAKLEAEQIQVAATARANRTERSASRPGRDVRGMQEYESDTARRRQQAQQVSSAGYRQEQAHLSATQYIHPAYQHSTTNVTRTMTSVQDVQPAPVLQSSSHNPIVQIQPSASSHSTSASNQVHASRTVSAPAPVAPAASSANPPPNQVQSQSQSQDQAQGHPRRTVTPPPAPKVFPMYLPPGADERTRLLKEAAERDKESERQREHEREAEKAREREERRARRAERERQKEMERGERERQKEIERAERERQKEVERVERERQRDLERAEREKAKELERREKERLKALERAERERQKAVERTEQERLQERERERERQYRSSQKHRSHRDKTQSLSIHPAAGVTSGSDTERLNRKDARHRSQSYPTAFLVETQPLLIPPETRQIESRKNPVTTQTSVPAPEPIAMQESSSNQDVKYSQVQTHSPALPVPPPLADRHDQVVYPRSASTVPTSQFQQPVPQNLSEESRADLNVPGDTLIGSGHTTVSMTQWPEPFHPAMQSSKLVSIYASQGPPDRTPARSTQKLESSAQAAERPTTGLSFSHPSANGYGGLGRSSAQDRPSYRPPTTVPEHASTPVLTSVPRPQSGLSALPQAPSAVSLRHYMMSSQPQPPMNSTTHTTLTPDPDQHLRSDSGGMPSHVRTMVSGTSSQPPSAISPDPMSSAHVSYDRSSIVPTAVLSQGIGFGSSSHPFVEVAGAQEAPQVAGQIQQPASVSRAASNNSTRSPKLRDSSQLPIPSSNDALPAMSAPRAVSDESGATETGGSRQPHSQPTQTHQGVPHSQQQVFPAAPAAPMYSSLLNSSTSRASHDPSTTSHRHSVLLTQSHSQSHPQPLPSNYAHSTSNQEIFSNRHEDSSIGPTAAHVPVSAAGFASQNSHNQQPYNQQPHPYSNVSYNPSVNAHHHTQSQSHLQPELLMSSTGHVNSTSHMPTSRAHPSHPTPPAVNPSSQNLSTVLSSQSVHPSTTLYHNHFSPRPNDTPTQTRPQNSNDTPKPPPQQNSSQVPYPSGKAPGPSPGPAASATYVTSTHQSGPFIDDSPSSLGLDISLDSLPPPNKPQPQQPPPPSGHSDAQPTHTRPRSVIAATSTPMRVISQVYPPNYNPARGQSTDIPPPLTPSNSSRDSHEEILMTPSSLDPSGTQPQEITVTLQRSESQRSEKKKSGLFGLFRSNSKSKEPKEAKEQAGPRGYRTRRQTPAAQRTESVNQPRPTRQPLGTAEAATKPTKADPVAAERHVKHPRTQKHVPPPIAIPPHPIPYRLFTSKSKRYRTMSSASLEALDGTANNTVVGSPTSSRRSPTPSGAGPLTPPARDPIRAAREWRNNEERAFAGRGSHRRRRPGVTFDMTDDDTPKNGANVRLTRTSSLHGPRGESSE
ncbi:hypothetical protein M0805_001792 [Coniferiporia weirii]|nr:hypothetical protein M0805_001792 [Coniferiporia weirii]